MEEYVDVEEISLNADTQVCFWLQLKLVSLGWDEVCSLLNQWSLE